MLGLHLAIGVVVAGKDMQSMVCSAQQKLSRREMICAPGPHRLAARRLQVHQRPTGRPARRGCFLVGRMSIGYRSGEALSARSLDGAPGKQVRRKPRERGVESRPRRRAASGTFEPNHCDAYYRQHDPGWHKKLESNAPYGIGDGLKAYSHGGGFAGAHPGGALDEYMRGSVPQCNETQLRIFVAGRRRRPNLPDVAREGCSAYFRGFERMRSCLNALGEERQESERNLRIGLSLWSPMLPLNGSCLFALLPPNPKVLDRVWWLPRRTLGVHVRRGDFDRRWPRATRDEWFKVVRSVLKERGLLKVFVASDDPGIHGEFVQEFGGGQLEGVVLPRFLRERFIPSGNRNVDRVRLWSHDGNLESLAEQLTLGTADFIIGSWGSTYSTLAAAWFDKPLIYVPRSVSQDCANATTDMPCRWRGGASKPSRGHVHGYKCGSLLVNLVDSLRAPINQSKYSRPKAIVFDQAVRYSRLIWAGVGRIRASQVALGRLRHGFDTPFQSSRLARRRRRGSNPPPPSGAHPKPSESAIQSGTPHPETQARENSDGPPATLESTSNVGDESTSHVETTMV